MNRETKKNKKKITENSGFKIALIIIIIILMN